MAPRTTLIEKVCLGLLLAVVSIIGLRTAWINHSYIGQDFVAHRGLMRAFPNPGGYNWTYTNPGGIYWLGSFFERHTPPGAAFKYISATLVGLNAGALWLLYLLIWECVGSRPLRWSAAALITFLPFRQIHSVVYSADALTIPCFAATAYLTWQLFRDVRRWACWIALGAVLTLGMFSKFSLVGLLPPVAVLLVVALWRQLPPSTFARWLVPLIVVLALPSFVFLYHMRENRRASAYTTTGQWLKPGEPPVMRWRDILLPKPSDARIFAAPQYFKDQVYETRNFSYPALIHLTVFTDSQNYFQPVPPELVADRAGREENFFERARAPRDDVLERWSVRWSLPFSLLAVAGTVYCLGLSVWTLLRRPAAIPEAALILTCLAAGTHGIILFNLPRLNDPYVPGFWLPRLAMPSLLIFFALGIIGLDIFLERHAARLRGGVGAATGGYTVIACALFVGFLAS